MVQPGFLENEDVKVWLDGVEPAWTLLSFDSYCQLRHPPSAPDACIQVGHTIGEDYCVQSPLVRNTIRLLKRCDEAGGLKLTATCNLVARTG